MDYIKFEVHKKECFEEGSLRTIPLSESDYRKNRGKKFDVPNALAVVGKYFYNWKHYAIQEILIPKTDKNILRLAHFKGSASKPVEKKLTKKQKEKAILIIQDSLELANTIINNAERQMSKEVRNPNKYSNYLINKYLKTIITEARAIEKLTFNLEKLKS